MLKEKRAIYTKRYSKCFPYIMSMLIGTIHFNLFEEMIYQFDRIWTFPRITDREKKSPIADKDSLRGLAPKFNRGEAVFEGNVLEIVEINVL